jgi:MerR family transcriptional regulator, light-induced transcriptional regulator
LVERKGMNESESGEGFSGRLRLLRKERNLRQRDLADVLGLAQTTIANYEQNTRFPDEATLKKIVDYFNTTLDFLLGRSKEPHGPNPAQESSQQGSMAGRSPLSPLARTYLQALLAGAKHEAMQMVLEKCRDEKSVKGIYNEVLQPALEEVGYLWETAAADVYEEHFVASTTVNLMAQVMQNAKPFHRRRGTFLSIVCPGELHEIGMRMVTDFLEIDGWKALYLGTNMPSGNIIKAVEDYKATLLGLSVTMQNSLNSAANVVASLRANRSCRDLKILVGGQAFRADPQLWKRMGADAHALSAEEAVEAADRLVAGGLSS